MNQKDRETLERLTDFNYDWYKKEVLDKQEHIETTSVAVEEPSKAYDRIPAHHRAVIAAGLADLEAGRVTLMDDFVNEMDKKFGL